MWSLTFYSVAELQQTFTNLSAVIFLLLDRSKEFAPYGCSFLAKGHRVFVDATALTGWL